MKCVKESWRQNRHLTQGISIYAQNDIRYTGKIQFDSLVTCNMERAGERAGNVSRRKIKLVLVQREMNGSKIQKAKRRWQEVNGFSGTLRRNCMVHPFTSMKLYVAFSMSTIARYLRRCDCVQFFFASFVDDFFPHWLHAGNHHHHRK